MSVLKISAVGLANLWIDVNRGWYFISLSIEIQEEESNNPHLHLFYIWCFKNGMWRVGYYDKEILVEPKKKESRRFLPWKAWDNLCQPKKLWGFNQSKKYNVALLEKLTWMVSKRDNLCMQASRSKYKVRHD